LAGLTALLYAATPTRRHRVVIVEGVPTGTGPSNGREVEPALTTHEPDGRPDSGAEFPRRAGAQRGGRRHPTELQHVSVPCVPSRSLTPVPGSTDASAQLPAIDGWFTADGGSAHLNGGKCAQCGTFVFPPRANNCPNPACDGDVLEQVPLSPRGTLWSYTENRYAPPPPYPAPTPFEPFAVAAVELADEGIIVLGKVVEGTLAADLKVGMEMELTTMPLFTDDDGVERIVHAWRIAR
jgi:uncharacterized OB-fold protein